ncbi:MAG TPA: retropepsin-like aspartic protease [Methylomirabilota bacterium]|nr:retropepsin-like aspartic protease [Methylomirabilota bacterium]
MSATPRGRSLLPIALAILLAGCAGGAAAPPPSDPGPVRVLLEAPTAARIRTVNNIMLVYATINGATGALLIVDTGAQRTVLTPALLKRMNVSVPDTAPRRKLYVMGGRSIDLPFIRVASVRTGGAVVENLEVGVYDVAPQSRVVDGLLGGDFLGRFKTTLDAREGLLRLEPLGR